MAEAVAIAISVDCSSGKTDTSIIFFLCKCVCILYSILHQHFYFETCCIHLLCYATVSVNTATVYKFDNICLF